MVATGPSGEKGFLFSGSIDGSIKVWRIPQQGLEFEEYGTWSSHKGAIQCFAVSYDHLYSGGMDGRIGVWHLSHHPQFVRFLDCASPVKSLFVGAIDGYGAQAQQEDDLYGEQQQGGRFRLFVGMANGQVGIWRGSS